VTLVDTSVWIASFRSPDGEAAPLLRKLLDDRDVGLAAPVRIELLIGISRREQSRFRLALGALPLFYPGASEWQTIEDWVETASTVGERFGFADLLIAAIASERGFPLWSLDQDFKRMARLGWLKLFEPEK
jgi:predicted nucleic acid-binding protein